MGDIGMQRAWLDGLRPGSVSGLFEFLPNTLYFAKDRELRLMAGNRAFVERCGFEKEEEMVGKTDPEIFNMELAEKYRSDDLKVIESGEPLTNLVELFPNRLGEPEWFITDKIPLFSREGDVEGLCGMVRSYEGTRASLQPYLDLVPVTDYLKQNYAEKVSMPALARKVGMTVRTLERRFKETFKTTPQNYIARLRILAACEFLAETAKPITEIALQVGFYDHSAFSHKFSKIMGSSPKNYRKRFQN